MTMLRKVMPASITALGEDEVQVVISTGNIARDDHIFMPSGAHLENYRKNPIVLWNHNVEHPPVGRGEDLQVSGDSIAARVRFAPTGISVKADEIRGLVKAGFINAVSVGIEPLQAEPLDPKKPRGGQRVSEWELLEFSFCNVPVDTGAMVTARAHGAADWKSGVSRTLPLSEGTFEAQAASESIFAWAGGVDFDPSRARKGFLLYDAAKPKDRSSYLLPIAHAVDGRLQVPKAGLRSVATSLAGTEIASGPKKTARAVIDHYQEQAGMGINTEHRDLEAKHTRALERAPARTTFKRGLYDVAQMAYMLDAMGYCHASSEYETALEGDDSPVPGMIAEALSAFAGAFKAAATEEADELMQAHAEADEPAGDDIETRDLSGEERAYIAAGKTPRVRAWRKGIAVARAGRALSTSNAKKIAEAQGSCERAMKHQKALGDHNTAVGEQLTAASTAHGKVAAAHAQVGDALADAKANPDKGAEHVARAMKAHKGMDSHMGDVADAHTQATDRCQDVGDAQNGISRSIKSVQRSLKAVVDGSTPGEDSDVKDIQDVEGGDGDSKGSRSAPSDYTRRQADLRSLDVASLEMI